MATEGQAKKPKATRPIEPRVHSDRPVDPKAAEIRAEPRPVVDDAFGLAIVDVATVGAVVPDALMHHVCAWVTASIRHSGGFPVAQRCHFELQRIVADDLCKSGCGVESLIAGGRNLIPGSVEDVAIRERRVLHVVTRPGGVPRVCVSVLSMTTCEIETSQLL